MEVVLAANPKLMLRPGAAALFLFVFSCTFTWLGPPESLGRYNWLPDDVKAWMFPVGAVFFGAVLLSMLVRTAASRLRPLTVRASDTAIVVPAWHWLGTRSYLPEQVTGAKLDGDSESRWIEVVHVDGTTRLPMYLFDSPETMERFCDAVQTYADRPSY